MDLRKQILSTPGALRETLEKGKPEFEEVIRRVRWGEGPIFMMGMGESFLAAQTGRLAFEGLLGWPVVARPAAEFEMYTSPVLRQRSVVLAISSSGETAATLSAARAARARGAAILALTNHSASALAQSADFAFVTRAGAASETGVHTRVCQQVALGYIALLGARILKRHHQQLDVLEDEYAKLPGHIESLQVHLADAVRALAEELKLARNLSIAGAGFYFPVALTSAWWLRRISRLNAEEIDLGALTTEDWPPASPGDAVLFLSGSHARTKKKIHAMAADFKARGGKILAVTDGNDRELLAASTLSLLLPGLSETVGAMLAMAVMQAALYHVAKGSRRENAPHSAGHLGAPGEPQPI